jgi:hypothetical protein
MNANIQPDRSTSERSIMEPLRLHFKAVNRIQIVTTDDRYETTLAEMADACKKHDDNALWRQHFVDFLHEIFLWCGERAELISKCYIAATSEGLRLFVVTSGADYRFELDDAITDFELRLRQIYPMCPVAIYQMPDASSEALQSFFSLERSYQIYGQPDST